MTPSHLAHSLLDLRGLVEREEQTHHVLHSIDSFSLQLRDADRHLSQVEAEVQELRSEAKKLKSKNRKLEKQVCRCSRERDDLALELENARAAHARKTEQMTHHLQALQGTSFAQQPRRKKTTANSAAQCQIITQCALHLLQEESQILQRRVDHLQQVYEEQASENKAKDIFIEELQLALQTSSRRRRRISEDEEDEKENDNSTLDNDSEKDLDLALPQWLETVNSESSESMQSSCQSMQEQKEEVDESQSVNSGWLQSVRRGSVRLCSFIFG